MKILLFGRKGQVGSALQQRLVSLGVLVALDAQSTIWCGDLTNLSGIAQTVQTVQPDIIVNAAAYTAVDQAEHDIDKARLVNTLAPGVLAHAARACGACLVHYSTDYVFDGSGQTPWVETDTTVPLNVYGQTKLEGEQAIVSAGCRHLIFRTSWVYGLQGHNFAKTMLRLAQTRSSLSVIDDQIGAPTGADFLADITANAIDIISSRPDTEGLYHVAAQGTVSWYGYARFVLDVAQRQGIALTVKPEAIVPITSQDFPTAARRPHNSRLNTNKLVSVFNLTIPSWQEGVENMLLSFIAQENNQHMTDKH